MPRKGGNQSRIKTPAEALRTVAQGLRVAAVRPNINGYVPHEKQIAFHSSTATVRGFFGGNRCLGKGTLVITASGDEVAIEDVEVGSEVLAMDLKTQQLVPSKVLQVYSNGVKQVSRFEFGRYQSKVSVIATQDHKIYAEEETRAKTRGVFPLSRGLRFDRPSRFRGIRGLGSAYGKDEDRALIYGLLLGDGHFARSNIQFTCADPSLVKGLPFNHRNGIQYGLKPYRPWRDWLDFEMDCWGTRSHNKFIHPRVWEWSTKSVEELAAGLFATDGSFFRTHDGFVHGSYNSISYQLISEFKRLLEFRLGIYGSTVLNDGRGCWSITFGTVEALAGIAELPIPGKKRDELINLLEYPVRSNSRSSILSFRGAVALGEMDTYDLLIDHPDHLFALANGLVVSNSGKTVGGATEGVWRATGRHPYQPVKPAPTTGRVVAVDFLNGVDKIVKPEIARWLPPSELINGSWEDSYDKAHNVLTLDNGSTIEFMSYVQETDAFAGTSRDWFWMDEEGPRDIFNENLLRIGDCGGVGWMTMTPLEGMTWVYDDIFEKSQTEEHIEVFIVDMDDNPHLNHGDMSVILSGLTEEEKEARKHGKFVQIGGLIYKCLSVANLMEPFIPPKDWLHVVGMDAGIRNPTAWVWAGIDPLGNIVVYDEYYMAGQTVAYHAQRVHEINGQHDREPDYYVGDPSIKNTDPITGTSILIEYVNHRIPIVLGNNDVRAGIDLVTSRLIGQGIPPNNLPALFFTKNCEITRKEMTRYRWAKWATRKANEERDKKEEPVKKNDHTCDAVRYLVSSRPKLDSGTSVPEKSLPGGASTALNPYTELVPEMSDQAAQGDYYLGAEY